MSAAPHAPVPIGVGIVGLSAAGGWAARAHVPALAAVDGLELRALSTSSAESARAAGDKYGVPAFASATELARHDDVDLVVVSVKVPHHRDMVLAALAAGKSVLSEWPLGNGLAEAQEMAAYAEDRGLRTFVGLQAQSAPVVRYLHDLVAEGYVGEVLSTSMIASGGSWGATHDSRSTYLLDRDNGATMLTIPFGHTVDGLALVLGEFTEITATTATRRPQVANHATGEQAAMTAEDQVAVSGILQSGAVASVHFRGGLSRGTNLHWEINGTDGDLIVAGDTGHLQFGQVTIRGARGKDRIMADLPVPARYDQVPELAGRRTEQAYTVAHAYHQVREDLTHGTRLAPDFAHAARRHRLIEAIQQSAATGQRQPQRTSAR